MALDVLSMTNDQLNYCLQEAAQVAAINDKYNSQIGNLVNGARDNVAYLIQNLKFHKLKSEFPDIYDKFKKNKSIQHALLRYRIMRVVATPIIFGPILLGISAFFGILGIGDDLMQSFFNEVLPVIGLLLTLLGIFKYSKHGWFAFVFDKIKQNSLQKFYDTVSASKIIENESVNNQQSKIDFLNKSWNEELSSLDPIAIICYESIPEDFRALSIIKKMQTILRQKRAENWKELANVVINDIKQENRDLLEQQSIMYQIEQNQNIEKNLQFITNDLLLNDGILKDINRGIMIKNQMGL